MYQGYAQQTPNRYPVGRQVFSEIREEGMLYVDKTREVYELTHLGGKYVFLSRPRRFGKTLLVSTLDAYFQGRRELFEGLAIDGLEQDWESYPVVRFDLSSVKSVTEDELEEDLDNVLLRMEALYGGGGGQQGWTSRVEGCIRAAVEQTGKPAVVLVDEYDAPLLNVLHDAERLQAFRQTMRRFYSPLKSLEQDIRFVFLTGITKFSQLSLFSELNNIQNVSMLPDFAGICGFTQDELDDCMAPDVAMLANRLGMAPREAYEALKEKYDGYRFCWPSPGVYNPYSLLNALEDGMLNDYWFTSGTPTALVNILKDSDFDLELLEGGLEADAVEFDAPTESAATPVAFM